MLTAWPRGASAENVGYCAIPTAIREMCNAKTTDGAVKHTLDNDLLTHARTHAHTLTEIYFLDWKEIDFLRMKLNLTCFTLHCFWFLFRHNNWNKFNMSLNPVVYVFLFLCESDVVFMTNIGHFLPFTGIAHGLPCPLPLISNIAAYSITSIEQRFWVLPSMDETRYWARHNTEDKQQDLQLANHPCY